MNAWNDTGLARMLGSNIKYPNMSSIMEFLLPMAADVRFPDRIDNQGNVTQDK